MIEERVTKAGKKRWRVRITTAGGQKVTVGTFERLRGEGGAQEAERQAREELAAGRFAGPCKLTIRQLMERYLRDGATLSCQDTTIAQHRKLAAYYVNPHIGDLRSAHVSAAQIATWQATLLREGKRRRGGPLSPKTVRNARGLVHAMYAWAASVHLLRLNPVADVDPPALADKALQLPDIATIQRYIDEMRGTRYWIGLVLGAATGMRRGEILGLRWCDVDLARGTVTIKRGLAQIDTRVVVHGPKTRSGKRVVVLPAFALTALREHHRAVAADLLLRGRSWDREARVCGDIKPDSFTRGVRDIPARLGLPHINPHRLRHALATEMLRQGVNAQVVQKQLGHSHVSTTLGMYAHLTDEDVAAAAALYGEAWRKVDEERSAKLGSHFGPKRRHARAEAAQRWGKEPAKGA